MLEASLSLSLFLSLSGFPSAAVRPLFETTFSGHSSLVWMVGGQRSPGSPLLGSMHLSLPPCGKPGRNQVKGHSCRGTCSTWFRAVAPAGGEVRRPCRSILGCGPRERSSEAAGVVLCQISLGQSLTPAKGILLHEAARTGLGAELEGWCDWVGTAHLPNPQ